MNKSLQTLVTGLALERLEENLFRGAVSDTLVKRVYGGKVLGEAMNAAQQTVADRPIHSLHAYFLREADSYSPVVYSVDRSRDGKSFSARRVTAIQHGQPIFTLEASFQKVESGIEFQRSMPEVPAIESLQPVQWNWDKFDSMTARYQRMMTIVAPFEIRAIDGPNGSHDAAGNPIRRAWVKTTEQLPDDPDIHRAILAYLSDYGLIWTLLAHHGFQLGADNLVVASLDHAMWFHRPFRMDEYLLYHCEGVSSAAARGLARGSFYSRSGELVASVTQEGLMRVV
ncbi:MAG: acyl-CoA thioesterase II [Gammaproteobacteria bacterium]|nr:acyl-CoA thioesterase II [Gammaproteobacteria bacterium]